MVASPVRRDVAGSVPHLAHPALQILGMHQTLGNQAIQHLASTCPAFSACPTGGACHTCPLRVQPKLIVGQPGDPYEQEADQVAEEVLRMPEPYRAESESEVAPDVEAQIDALRDGRHPLSESIRAFFEPRFGYDFSQVRVHTDARAAESAQAINARAYTLGRSIVFGPGQYAPGTPAGQRLLAHELAHVVQQNDSMRARPSAPPLIQRQVGAVAGTLQVGAVAGTLLGRGWLMLPNALKAQLIDQAIQMAITAVDNFPGRTVVGRLWVFMRPALLGFYHQLLETTQATKILVFDKLARIVAGESTAFALGFLKGLLKGFFIDGLLGIFIAIWELGNALWNLWQFFDRFFAYIARVPEEIRQIAEGFQSLAQELIAQMEPAIREVRSFFAEPGRASALMDMIVEQGREQADRAGRQIARALIRYFTRPGAEAEIGETTGSIVGMVLFEVVLAALTAGGGAALTGVKAAARFVGRLVGRVVAEALTVFRELVGLLGPVVRAIRAAARFVRGRIIGGLMERFAGLLDNVTNLLRRFLRACRPGSIRCDLPEAPPAAGAARAPARPPVPAAVTEAAMAREIFRARRIPIGRVPPHQMPPHPPETTSFGDAMHDLLEPVIRQRWPDRRFRRTPRGVEGPDMIARGAPDFDWIEIKPNTASGVETFVRREWGKSGVWSGRGRLAVYDSQGNIDLIDFELWTR